MENDFGVETYVLRSPRKQFLNLDRTNLEYRILPRCTGNACGLCSTGTTAVVRNFNKVEVKIAKMLFLGPKQVFCMVKIEKYFSGTIFEFSQSFQAYRDLYMNLPVLSTGT